MPECLVVEKVLVDERSVVLTFLVGLQVVIVNGKVFVVNEVESRRVTVWIVFVVCGLPVTIVVVVASLSVFVLVIVLCSV